MQCSAGMHLPLPPPPPRDVTWAVGGQWSRARAWLLLSSSHHTGNIDRPMPMLTLAEGIQLTMVVGTLPGTDIE